MALRGKTEQLVLSRRQFLTAALISGGMMALSGCAQAPRNSTAGRNEALSSSSQTGASASAAAQGGSASEAAGSSASASPASSSGAAEASSAQAANGALVAVFSWSGNTLAVANRVAESLQADLFRIEPATPYTTDYDEMLQIAQDEQAANTLPALAAGVQNWGDYSTIYLGFPTWWGHLPQIVKSFLSEHDCSGKTVYPFNTHAGSGFASCLSDLSAACPGADVREGLSIPGDEVQSSTAQIDAWVATSA